MDGGVEGGVAQTGTLFISCIVSYQSSFSSLHQWSTLSTVVVLKYRLL